jgi:ABC-2 type transport system permease protein
VDEAALAALDAVSLAVGFLLTIALPVLFAAVTSSHWGSMSPHEHADRHPLDIALAGVNLSQLAIAVLGVLVITREYSTGMIRATFTARCRSGSRCSGPRPRSSGR